MNSLKRDYKMSDAELCMLASNLKVSMTRDSIEFTNRGITAEMFDTFKNLGDAFEIFPADSYYLANCMMAIETKNATRESLYIKLRAIIGYAKIMWGQNSIQVKRFEAGLMKRLNDKNLLATCRMAVLVAEDYFTELSTIGLTAEMINDLDSSCQIFEDNVHAVANAQAAREINAQERITKGNELYSFVQKYCLIGKIIWEDVNEAKYRDYVLHSSKDLQVIET